MSLTVKLRIVRVAVRTVFAVVALSVIGWLYLGPITLQAPDDGEPLKCEPLGKSDLDSYYMANFSDYDTRKRILYYMDNEIMDSKKRFDTDTRKSLEQGWERGCQLAREGRRDLLMIVLVLSATIFLALGSRKPFPRLVKPTSLDSPAASGTDVEQTSVSGADAELTLETALDVQASDDTEGKAEECR
mgnify:CR=1 FL=1